MKLAFQLAYKNLVGAGLRTWLNVLVLSFSFVMIIFFNGMMDGWNQQAKTDTIAWEAGQGHLLNENYDPYDPFSLLDGHGEIPANAENLAPILIRQASIYPDGRMISLALKGIATDQEAVELPTPALAESEAALPAIIGKRMAQSTKLEVGDEVLLRWRDKNGTFDATNVTIVEIFDNTVGTTDAGQIWIDIEDLWDMTGLQGRATMFIAEAGYQPEPIEGWEFTSQEELLSDIDKIIASKKIGSSVMYLLLLTIALLAIFDTQVLSIFRRQKEIGTYVSLGMTRWQVVGLFTVEGAMYSIFAMLLGCLYGIPLFIYMATEGIAMPQASQDMGVSLAEKIFPVYGIQLVIGTILLVVIAATLVSFLPARKIAKMDPVAALKGKLQ
jgi:putative ABC transport system permease protein